MRSTELLPTSGPDPLPLLREQAEPLFASLIKSANRETLLMVNPLLARLIDSEKNR